MQASKFGPVAANELHTDVSNYFEPGARHRLSAGALAEESLVGDRAAILEQRGTGEGGSCIRRVLNDKTGRV